MIALLALRWSLAATAAAADPLLAALDLPCETRRLANGLTVVLQPDSTTPLVAVHLRYPVGAANDGPRPGMAHLLEHLMYRGSPRAPDGAYDALLGEVGGRNNAWTSADAMAFQALVPRDGLELVLALEADRMGGLRLSEAALEAELGVVARERDGARQRAAGLMGPTALAALFPPAHPYGHAVDGGATGLQGVRIADVIGWHADHLGPAGAVLSVAGDIDPAVVWAQIDATLARVPDRPLAAAPVAVATTAAQRFQVDDRRADGALVVQWATVPRGHADEAALDVLAGVLDLGLAPYAPRQVLGWRHRKGSLRASTDNRRLGGVFRIEADGLRGRLDGPAASLLDLVERLRGGPPEAALVGAVQLRWRLGAARAVEELDARAAALAECVAVYGRPDCLRDEQLRRDAVRPQDLVAVAQRRLDPALAVVVGFNPHSRPGWALWAAPGLDVDAESAPPPSAPDPGPPAADPDLPPIAVDVVALDLPGWTPAPPAVIDAALPRRVWVVAAGRGPLVRMDLSVPVSQEPADDPVSLVLARLLAEGHWLDQQARGALAVREASARAGLGLLRLWVDIDAPQGDAPEAFDRVIAALDGARFTRRQVRRARRTLLAESTQGWLIASEVHRAALRQVAYGPVHPLTTPVDRAGLRQVRPSHVEARLRGLVADGRPSLAVVGPADLDGATVAAALARWAGQGAAALLPAPAWTDGLTLVDQPGETQVQVSLLAPAPGAFDPALPAAEVLARVMGGALTGRLDRALRVERGWVYAVDSSVQAWPGHGVLLIQCTVDPLMLADVLALVDDELSRLTREPPDAREVAIARRALLLEEVETQANSVRLANALGAQAAYGGAPESRSQRVAALRAVDGAAVLEALRATGLGDAGGPVRWVITGDAALVEEALDAAGRTPDRIWSGRTLLPPT